MTTKPEPDLFNCGASGPFTVAHEEDRWIPRVRFAPVRASLMGYGLGARGRDGTASISYAEALELALVREAGRG